MRFDFEEKIMILFIKIYVMRIASHSHKYISTYYNLGMLIEKFMLILG